MANNATRLAQFIKIRNETIQMFRELTNNQREILMHRLVANPLLPNEIRGIDAVPIPDIGRKFWIFMTMPRVARIWAELNAIIAALLLYHMNINRAMSLYYIIHDELLAMGINPSPGDAETNPPAIPWIDQMAYTDQEHFELSIAGGIINPIYMEPPTIAQAPYPGSSRFPLQRSNPPRSSSLPANAPVGTILNNNNSYSQDNNEVHNNSFYQTQTSSLQNVNRFYTARETIPIRNGPELIMKINDISGAKNAPSQEEFKNGDIVDILYRPDQVLLLNNGQEVNIKPGMMLLSNSADGHFQHFSINPYNRKNVALRVRRKLKINRNPSGGKSRRSKSSRRNQRKRSLKRK